LKKALGLIEAVGLVTAIQAMDAAGKSANVTLLGLENSRGGGRMTVKLEGDVGAVTAAVEAGLQAAALIGEVCAVKVIARPSDELERYIHLVETSAGQRSGNGAIPEEKTTEATCNICHDPACPRRWGGARTDCIHHKNNGERKQIRRIGGT